MTEDQRRFHAETAHFRQELVAYCYRMAGSASEADDLVQETYLRAWRAYESFERRASMRSWLYKIASNVCLTALESRRSRVLPSALGGPCAADREPTRVVEGGSWLEPLPDAWLEAADPAATVIARESVRLALIASLQTLTPLQRAIFVLREVLSYSSEEAAQVLDCSVAAIKSGLQRVRARLEESIHVPEATLAPTDARARALLDGYIAAFERSDASLLLQVLRSDATLEATPFRDWQAGKADCVRLLASHVLGTPGDWKMIATRANGQPAATVYRRDPYGNLQPSGIVVLTATASGISRVVAFHHEPGLVQLFERDRA